MFKGQTIMPIIRELVGVLGVLSALTLYWGYLAAQEPFRIRFGHPIPMSPQEYWLPGILCLLFIGALTVVGFRMGTEWGLEGSFGNGKFICLLVAVLAPFVISAMMLTAGSVGRWGLYVMAPCVFLVAFALGLLTVRTLAGFELKAQVDSQFATLDNVLLQELAVPKGGDGVEGLNDIGRLIVAHRMEMAQQSKADTDSLRKRLDQADLKVGAWFAPLTVAIVLMVYLLVTGMFVRSAGVRAFPTPPVSRFVTKEAISELPLAARDGTHFVYEGIVMGRAEGQVYVLAPDKRTAITIPAADVLRVVVVSR